MVRFEIRRGSDKRYSWALRKRKPLGASAQTYATWAACNTAIKRIKANVGDAPVDDGAAAAPLRFRREQTPRGFRWRLVTRNGRPVAVSTAPSATAAAALKAINAFRDGALLAPLPQTFRVAEALPTWAAPLTLVAIAPADFGGTPGTVRLTGAGGRSETLTVLEWESEPGKVVVQAPEAPFSGPHTLVVETPLRLGQLAVVPLEPLVFRVVELRLGWGYPVTLESVAPLTFGDRAGKVALVNPPAKERLELSVTDAWSRSRLTVRLPEKPPFPGAYHLVVETPSSRGELPVVVEDILSEEIANRLKRLLEAVSLTGQPTTVDPGVPVPVSIVNFPPSRISFPPRDFDVDVSVSWRVHGVETDEWWKKEGAEFLIAPRPVAASVGTEPGADVVTIEATLTLTVATITVARTVSLELRVKRLQLPTVALFFTHNYFQPTVPREPGCVLAFVRPGSLDLRAGAVVAALDSLGDALRRLALRFPTLPWLAAVGEAAAQVQRVASALGDVANKMGTDEGMTKGHKVRVVTGSGVRRADSRELHFWSDGLYVHTAEDNFGSMCLLGTPGGESIRVYNARDYHSKEGLFFLWLPDKHIAALVEDFHARPPGAWPPGAIDPWLPPDGGNYGNRISSFHWGPERPPE